ncbi:MAG: uroporphyrinogen decarboxylase family protein [Chloroflexota bacterium]|nr:uroporphyrinogen decarboxylase family protein [Chloroflexota bacterium]
MKKMTGLERILTALKRQQPDRVPHFEMLIDKKVRDAIMQNPNASYADFVEFMDIDAIFIFDKTMTWTYETIDDKTKRDQWGGIVRFTTTDLGHPMQPAIKSEKDLDTYVAPDPDDPRRYEELMRLVKRFKGERAIIAHATDVFDIAKESLLGDVAYFKAMIKNPELIDRVNEIVTNYELRFLKNCLEAGADIVMTSGDYAVTKGPMVSRELTKRFLTPPLQKITALAHDYGKPCCKHTDGNIWPIYDIILDTGIDGINPIDPMAGMDMGDAKAVFGDKVCLMGNVSCAFSLVTGSTDEVRQETRDVIRKAGKGGGLIVMSSNSIHSGVKPENYVAMIEAIKEYGKYPLDWSKLIPTYRTGGGK